MTHSRLLDRQQSTYGAGDPLAELCTSVLEALPVGVALFGPDGHLLRGNPAFHALLDVAGQGGVQSLHDITSHGGEVLEHAVARARRGDRLGPLCVSFGRGATRLMDVSLMPIALPDGRTGIAVSLVPTTGVDAHSAKAGATADGVPTEPSRSRAVPAPTATDAPPTAWSTELDALLAEQARRARERRLAAVGQLAAGVMHDVNNALNPIVAAAHLLGLHADDPDAVRDYARRIARAAETAAATAARVGRFIRQEPLAEGMHRFVDLGAVADEVVAMTRPLWAERAGGGLIALDYDCPHGTQVRGNAGEIREALLNLVQNALDAMIGGGVLSVRIVQEPQAATLEVSDSGAGMTSEVRERAFEPFFTTKGVRGSGLGLSEVWGIMKRHRGHAEIDSLPGHGTTVRLVFPRTEAHRRASGEMLAIPSRPPRRVLLVEDHVDSREFMLALLVADGHLVTAVGSAGDARAQLEGHGPFDLLVTDLGLPDGSGRDLVREARQRWPALRVGVVTGWEPHALRESLPAHFTLRKPVRVADLLACVAGDG